MNRRGLVLLVSAQAVPNIQALLALRPDRAVVLVTPEMAGRNDRWLIRAAARAEATPPEGFHAVRIPRADLPGPTEEALARIFSRNPGWSWDVLLNGGTKPMALGAFTAARAAGARCLYADLSRPGEILDLAGGEPVPLRGPLPLGVFLAAHGFEVEGTAEDDTRRERALAYHLARCATTPPYDDTRQALRPEVPPEVARILEEKVPGLAAGNIVDQRWRNFLAGGWLEVFLCMVLERTAGQLGLRDVVRGLRIVDGRGAVRNEIDVAAMGLHGLVAFEAKTGGRLGEDAVYKFATVLRQLRALAVHGVMVIAGAGMEAAGEAFRSRAELLGIRVVDGRDVEFLADHQDPATVAGRLGLGGVVP